MDPGKTAGLSSPHPRDWFLESVPVGSSQAGRGPISTPSLNLGWRHCPSCGTRTLGPGTRGLGGPPVLTLLTLLPCKTACLFPWPGDLV